MRRCVWSRNLVIEEALAHLGLLCQKQTNKAKVTLRSITSGDNSVSRNSATLLARVNNRSIFARKWVYTWSRQKTNNFNSYSTTNKMRLLSQIIYSCKTLYMFRTVCCYLLAAGSSSCLIYIVAVYAVLSPWWWTERPSETCRWFYKNKCEITGASCLLYFFFSCGAATQRGSWPPHSWGFSRSHTTTHHSR